jgi:hypothetical protein
VNHAFSEGKLDQKSIDAIVHDTGKILD